MRFIVVELDSVRTNPDDRPLGVNGSFLAGTYSQLDIKEFATEATAEAAANAAPNRRAGCSLWVSGAKRRAA